MHEAVDDVAKRRTVLQEGGDVLEEDPLGREVLDVPDFRFQVRDVHRPLSYLRCRGAPGPKCPLDEGMMTPIEGQVGDVDEPLARVGAPNPRILGLERPTQAAVAPRLLALRLLQAVRRVGCCSRNKCSAWSNSLWPNSPPSGR